MNLSGHQHDMPMAHSTAVSHGCLFSHCIRAACVPSHLWRKQALPQRSPKHWGLLLWTILVSVPHALGWVYELTGICEVEENTELILMIFGELKTTMVLVNVL